MLVLQLLLVIAQALHLSLQFDDYLRVLVFQFFHVPQENLSDSVLEANHKAGLSLGLLRFTLENFDFLFVAAIQHLGLLNFQLELNLLYLRCCFIGLGINVHDENLFLTLNKLFFMLLLHFFHLLSKHLLNSLLKAHHDFSFFL